MKREEQHRSNYANDELQRRRKAIKTFRAKLVGLVYRFHEFSGQQLYAVEAYSDVIQNICQKRMDSKSYEHIKDEAKIYKEEVLNAFEEQLYEYLKQLYCW